MLFYISNHK